MHPNEKSTEELYIHALQSHIFCIKQQDYEVAELWLEFSRSVLAKILKSKKSCGQ